MLKVFKFKRLWRQIETIDWLRYLMWDINVAGNAASLLGLGISIYALVEVARLKKKTRAVISQAVQKQRLMLFLVELERLISLASEAQNDLGSFRHALPQLRSLVAICQFSEFVQQGERLFFQGAIVNLRAIRRFGQSSKDWLHKLETACIGCRSRLQKQLNSGEAFDV